MQCSYYLLSPPHSLSSSLPPYPLPLSFTPSVPPPLPLSFTPPPSHFNTDHYFILRYSKKRDYFGDNTRLNDSLEGEQNHTIQCTHLSPPIPPPPDLHHLLPPFPLSPSSPTSLSLFPFFLPLSLSTCICLVFPSARKDKAQQASTCTSRTGCCMSLAREGNA